MPFEKFESIKSADELFQFFEENFPDSIPLIGKEELQTSFFKNPVGPLVTVKCAPYHYKDKCVIIGDAAHAMVPFYGQGMNCGFEDVLVLDQILSNPNAGKSIEERLNLYTETRHKDAVAICELALNNYIEMRSGVLTWAYYAKKITEEFLYRIIPKTVIPLYTMVSFTRIPYSQVIERNKQQSFWIKSVAGAGIGSILGFTLWKTAKIILKLKSI